jgi:hypothetical protein
MVTVPVPGAGGTHLALTDVLIVLLECVSVLGHPEDSRAGWFISGVKVPTPPPEKSPGLSPASGAHAKPRKPCSA